MGREYVIGIISAVVAGGAAELILPDREGGEGKTFRFVISLLVLSVIALPLIDGVLDAPRAITDRLDALFDAAEAMVDDAEIYAAEAEAYIRAASADAAEEEIALLLVERFGIPAHTVRTELTLGIDAEGMIVPCDIRVFLRGSAVFCDSYAVEAYLEALFGGICTVIIE